MSETRFVQLLQELLTMVDPDSATSVACVKSTLENILALAKESGKADARTIRMIMVTIDQIEHLFCYREDFAGTPGDHSGNTAKQHRLLQMLRPGC